MARPARYFSNFGMRHSPVGSRFRSSISSACQKGPVIGGSFAPWAGLFSVFDCSFHYLRQREDSFNPIASGACTGAFLAMRSGPRVMFFSGLGGGIILAMFEGFGFLLQRQQALGHQQHQEQKQRAYMDQIHQMQH